MGDENASSRLQRPSGSVDDSATSNDSHRDASQNAQQTEPNETTRLLNKSNPATDADDGEDIENGISKKIRGDAHNIFHELWILFRSAIPVILAYMLQNSLQTISIAIVGRLSAEALATASFAYMFAMATGWLIALGGTSAIDTLASTSHTGSANPKDLGVILQRAFIVLGLFYIPVLVLWFVSEPLFTALKQPSYVAHDAPRFLMVLAPGGLGYIYFECMKKYLQAQEIMRPGTYALLITSPLNALLNWLFVYPFGMGLLGAPLATGISYWLSFLLLVLYVRFLNPKARSCWGGWTKGCLRNMGSFTRLAVLGVIQVGSEWWAFEIVAIVAGTLGTVSLASQAVIMTADQILNTIPFGLGVAASSRLGNLLGAKDAKGARRSAHVAAVLSIVLGTIVLAILLGVKDVFAKVFNDDEAVVDLTAHVMPFVALFQIADGLVGSCGGILRGQGRQHIGAAVNVVSYYCGALPLGIWLAYNGWGLEGLWIGQCIALYLVGVAEWLIVALSNWDYQVEKALKRLDKAETPQEETIGTAPDEQ